MIEGYIETSPIESAKWRLDNPMKVMICEGSTGLQVEVRFNNETGCFEAYDRGEWYLDELVADPRFTYHIPSTPAKEVQQ